jgi:FMN phosphatase YigB (HAD superfamily)
MLASLLSRGEAKGMQLFVNWLIRRPKGAVYDVDDSLIESEGLQLKTWIMALIVHCWRQSASATNHQDLKSAVIEDFIRWVFRTGNFNILMDGFILLLTIFKWRPESLFVAFNEKTPFFQETVSLLVRRVTLAGYELPRELFHEGWLNRDDIESEEILANIRTSKAILEEFFAPIRIGIMMTSIKERGPRRFILPGVLEHLRAAKDQGVKIGFFTSSPKDVSENLLNLIFGNDLDLLFPEDARLYGDQVERKPNPRGWFQVADRLNVPPEETLVIDDRASAIRNCLSREAIQRYLPNETRTFGAGVVILGRHGSEAAVRQQLAEIAPDNYAVIPALKHLRWRVPSTDIIKGADLFQEEI